MHSGGSTKVKPYNKLYMEAPQRIAEIVFYNRFGRNPHRITCTCCGEDYSLSEYDSLEQASAYHRNCAYDKKEERWIEQPDTSYGSRKELISLKDYCASEDVLVIRADEITDEEKIGYLPQEGWTWV